MVFLLKAGYGVKTKSAVMVPERPTGASLRPAIVRYRRLGDTAN
jgi:hypothetical protein